MLLFSHTYILFLYSPPRLCNFYQILFKIIFHFAVHLKNGLMSKKPFTKSTIISCLWIDTWLETQLQWFQHHIKPCHSSMLIVGEWLAMFLASTDVYYWRMWSWQLAVKVLLYSRKSRLIILFKIWWATLCKNEKYFLKNWVFRSLRPFFFLRSREPIWMIFFKLCIKVYFIYWQKFFSNELSKN